MLLRLITIISLIKLLLMMISGNSMEVALYRSILVFLILFTALYLTMFLLNVIRENPDTEQKRSTVPDVNRVSGSKEE